MRPQRAASGLSRVRSLGDSGSSSRGVPPVFGAWRISDDRRRVVSALRVPARSQDRSRGVRVSGGILGTESQRVGMVDPRLAAASIQVLRASLSSEEAVTHLEGGNARDGQKALQKSLSALERARDRLPPSEEARLALVEAMIAVYGSLIDALDRGQPPESVAELVVAQEGDLWAAGPLLG